MVSWNQKEIDDWRQKDENAKINDPWARTDDGDQQGWTGTDKNQQANYAPQRGGSSGAYGSSGADGNSAAPAANGGSQIRLSQLSDRKDDGTGPAYPYTKPPVLYMVVRADLDTIKLRPDDIHTLAKDTNKFQLEVWISATTGYQRHVRSNFYHCTDDFDIAKQRAEQGNLKGKRLQNGFIVMIDVWHLFKENKIKDEDFIDLSSEEAQRRFFDEDVISQNNLNALTYHKNHTEHMLCWKGMFLEFWYMTDPNGNPTELLKPLLDYDEDALEVQGWKGQNRPAGGGAQPSPPSTTVAATTMDSRHTADQAQDQAMGVTDTAAAAGSAPAAVQ